MATVEKNPIAVPPQTAVGGDLPEPRLFRFGLRQMFVFVSGLAALGGAMALVRGGWAVGMGFGAAMVAAHVLATLVGTRLRDHSSRVNAARGGSQTDPGALPSRAQRLSAAELAALSATPLARHEHAPYRTLLSVVGGAAGGGFFGAAVIPLMAGPPVTAAELGLGAASCAVMGAWLALLAAHFWSVLRRTWRDANGEAPAASPSRRKRMFRRV